MNIRSLTRGDGVVIGAAVLLFIASLLDVASCDGPDSLCSTVPNAWGFSLGLGLGTYMAGVVGGALIVLARLLPQPRKVAGLDMGTIGVALTVAAAWSLLWWTIDTDGSGIGLILGLIAALLLAAGAIASPLLPPLQAALLPAPAPQPPSPTAPSLPAATATRVPVPRSPVSPSAGSRRRASRASPTVPSSRKPRSRRHRSPRLSPAVTSRRSGSPCPCRVPCSRRTVRSSRSPNWRRGPGTWLSSSAVRAWSRRRRTAVGVCCRTPPGFSAAEPSKYPY